MNNRIFFRGLSLLILSISWMILDLGNFALIQANLAESLRGGEDGEDTASGSDRNPCDELGLDLTPIVTQADNPETGFSNWGKTHVATPSLWVYIPYTREQLSRATLSIRKGEKEAIVYHDRISLDTLGQTPGLVNIALEELDISLETEHWYRWYLFLNVYCTEDSEQPEKEEISAWIQYQDNESGDRLYDRLAEIDVIEDSQARKNAWIVVLQELGYNAIAKELLTSEN
ncbi:MAG: DUF928 domain-containing protein [Cyanobacteria bacterium SBLK]|nr:DUF928 domain-containing protein [Cyanobacteria bacterium SBLK]